MKKKILAVDDSSAIRKLVEFSLKSAGFLVATVQNGQEALEAIAKSQFDAIILDINMPKMDGFEFLKQAKPQAAYAAIPIIMLTTEGQDEDKERALALGATDYIVKPFKPTELIAAMQKLFQ